MLTIDVYDKDRKGNLKRGRDEAWEITGIGREMDTRESVITYATLTLRREGQTGFLRIDADQFAKLVAWFQMPICSYTSSEGTTI